MSIMTRIVCYIWSWSGLFSIIVSISVHWENKIRTTSLKNRVYKNIVISQWFIQEYLVSDLVKGGQKELNLVSGVLLSKPYRSNEFGYCNHLFCHSQLELT